MMPRELHEGLEQLPPSERLGALLCAAMECDTRGAQAVVAVLDVATVLAKHLAPTDRATLATEMIVAARHLAPSSLETAMQLAQLIWLIARRLDDRERCVCALALNNIAVDLDRLASTQWH
jgi:hypothetical protein